MEDAARVRIGERLRDLRTSKELTQTVLAKGLEVIYNELIRDAKEKKTFNEENGKITVSALENGTRSINIDIAIAYSTFFGVSLDYILCREDAERIIVKDAIYKHFKGGLYKVIDTAKDSETCELMVVYRALYGKNDLWVRPIDMFLEEVPAGKENPTGQRYRFEIANC